MSNLLVDTTAITGWGVDADPDNDPAWPMRRTEDMQTRGLTWPRPAQQYPEVEVLRSIEHNRLPAVVGTSSPPSGVSGAIRRYAFRRSESDWWHWLLLMGADRLNMVEGLVVDVAQGKLPNIPAEMGIRAEWQHNRAGLVRKIGWSLVAGPLLVAYTRAWREAGTAGRFTEADAIAVSTSGGPDVFPAGTV